MANIKSAKKRVLTSERNRQINLARNSEIKTYTKKFMAALEDNNVESARELFKQTKSKVERAYNKGLIKRNAASRRISNLARRLKAADLAQAAQ